MPVSGGVDAETLALIVRKALPVAVVVDADCLATTQRALELAGAVGEHAPSLLHSGPLGALEQRGRDRLLDGTATAASLESGRGSSDTGALLFTSGSTGSPKGAVFSDVDLVPVGPVPPKPRHVIIQVRTCTCIDVAGTNMW